MNERAQVPKISLPKNLLVVGCTQAGKSHFVKKLLLDSEAIFTPSVSRIIYVYGAWNDGFIELENSLGDRIEFRQDIPTKDELVELRNSSDHGPIVIVLDDRMCSLEDNKQGASVVELVTVLGHHLNLSCIITLQSAFVNKTVRLVSQNCPYLCLFKNPRNAFQIRTIARQSMPTQWRFFVDSYEKATAENYGYLFVDLSPNSCEKFRLMSHIFSDEDTRVYLPAG